MDQYYQDTFLRFESLRQDRILCDVVLQVESEFFYVHKFILCATSDFFRALFTVDMKERRQEIIQLHDVTAEIFRNVLSFLYSGKPDVNEENIYELLRTSSFLQIPHLKKICVEFMKINLTVKNCLEYYQLSKVFCCDDLLPHIINFFVDNAEDILKTSDSFCFLDNEFMTKLLSSDEVRISDESVLYDALTRWILHDEDNRKQYFCDLIRHLRLPNMSNHHLNIMMKNKLVSDCFNCQNYVQASLDLQHSAHESTFDHITASVRGLGQILIVDKKCQKFTTLSTRDGKYMKMSLPHIPMKAFFKSAVVCGSKLRLLGGMNKQQVFSCDFKHGKAWRELPSMSIKRNFSCGFCVTIKHENKVYVIGGSNGERFLSEIECFAEEKHEWEVLPRMPTARSDTSSAGKDGFIYAIGGWNGEYLNKVERYDINERTWKTVTPMNTARSCATAKCCNGMIYVMGGRNRTGNLATTEVYNIEKDTWTRLPNMNHARINFGACESKGVLYVVGGDTDSKASSYEYWNDQLNKWIPSKDVNTHGYCKSFAIS